MAKVKVKNLLGQVVNVIIAREVSYTSGGSTLTQDRSGLKVINKTSEKTMPSSTLSIPPKETVEIDRDEVTQDLLRKRDKKILELTEMP